MPSNDMQKKWSISDIKKLPPDEIALLLNEKESRFRNLFELTNDAIFLIDMDGYYIDVNTKAAELLGFQKEDLIGSSAYDFIAPSDISDSKEKLKNIKKGDILPLYERRFRRKDGSEFLAEINLSMVVDSKGSRKYIQSIVRNISNRKKIEEELRYSEEQFRLSFENAKDAIFWADPESFLIINCNKAAEKILEKNYNEIIGQNQQILHPPEKINEYRERFKKSIQSGSAEGEGEIYTKSGKIIPVFIASSIINFRGKKILQGIFTDISKQKDAEEKYKALFREARDGIILVDFDTGYIIDANPAFEHISRKKLQELQKIKIWEVRSSKYQNFAQKKFLEIRANVDKMHELEVHNEYGISIPMEFSSCVITLHGKKYLLSVMRDISERRKVEEKLKQQQELLQKQKDELEAFASTIAHDIRGKLQVISIYNELILDSIYSEKISEQIKEITTFLENLLLLAKEGEILGDLRNFDLNIIVHDVVTKIKTIDPKLIFEIKKLPILKGNSQKIHQVFENLLINISKHAKATKVKIYSEKNSAYYYIYVKDNGIGMSDKFKQKILDSWETKTYIGLGLLIVKKIIDAHKGTITFKSAENKGTTFIIKLPII